MVLFYNIEIDVFVLAKILSNGIPLKAFHFSQEDEIAAAIRVKPSDLRDEDKDWDEYQPISSCGTLDIALHYILSDKKLQITVLDAKDLPSKERGGASIVQVRRISKQFE